MISVSTVDEILTLRACYVKPPAENHLIEKQKLLKCHVLMRIRRRFIRIYFDRLKVSETKSLYNESKSHIGIVKWYDPLQHNYSRE